MKKIVIFLFLLPLLLTACSSGQQTGTDEAVNDGQFAQPETQPDIRGTIKSIIGNEVVISSMQMGEGGGSGGGAGAMASGGEMPAGGPSGGEMPQMSEEQIANMKAKMAEMPTEDVKVIFPVGIAMGLQTMESGKMTTEEASLEDVKTGLTASVWLNQSSSSDRNIAEAVLLVQRSN